MIILILAEVEAAEEEAGWSSRFLAQRSIKCNKYPKICRAKGSSGRDCCKKRCVNVGTDRVNCGRCGHKCKFSEICCKGKCVNPFTHKKHCGGCGNKKVHVGYSVKSSQLSAITVNVKRFKFVVNVVDHTSNASLLLWDREGSQLLGRNVTDFVAPKNSIPALIEEILVGQNVLFKLQLKNHIEYYRSYPFTVNKVCNLPEVVDKYTPKDLGEQIFKFDTRLSDLLFGADLAEVSQKPYVTTDLSTLANENISDLFVEGSELNIGVDVAEVFLFIFLLF
ncbi:hypothetical protein SASPL_121222 [Salvia splendens]|uniref:Replication factor A1 n=1 Tax=Salvia splendens TaxID=180675 RepID=A0A8X8XTY6_SALSN|nr:hypothetical protein SASPL_121222 [Salvia splendens]